MYVLFHLCGQNYTSILILAKP
ncbi:hypothetical protein AALP_AAs61285U000100, partial [Arabis alpina]